MVLRGFRLLAVFLGFAAAWTAGQSAWAADHLVVQANKTFVGDLPKAKLDEILKDPEVARQSALETLAVKKGDTVTFLNSDTVNHHVYTSSFNEKQDPGKSSKLTFADKGEVLVRCAIHPKMKLRVSVTE